MRNSSVKHCHPSRAYLEVECGSNQSHRYGNKDNNTRKEAYAGHNQKQKLHRGRKNALIDWLIGMVQRNPSFHFSRVTLVQHFVFSLLSVQAEKKVGGNSVVREKSQRGEASSQTLDVHNKFSPGRMVSYLIDVHLQGQKKNTSKSVTSASLGI